MSKEKSNLKILWDTQWGNKFDDLKERSVREFNECRGAQAALKGAITNLSSLHEFIDKDLEMVESGAVPEGTKRPLPRDQEGAQYAKSYLIRSVKSLENLLMKAAKEELICNGRASMATDMVNTAKKSIDMERSRITLLVEAEETGTPERNVGREEAMSAADDIQQRRADAKAAKAAKAAIDAQAESEPSSNVDEKEGIAVEEVTASSKSAPKKRRRKSKTTNGVKEPTANGQNPG